MHTSIQTSVLAACLLSVLHVRADTTQFITKLLNVNILVLTGSKLRVKALAATTGMYFAIECT